jgi:4-alpha-glucanotransferase
MLGERASGILLHPTSFPSRGGMGDFGPEAQRFIEFLASARQRLWQVLPLSPLGMENSPYSSTSAFAGNPLLVSLEVLARHGWIDAGKLSSLPEDDGDINYDEVRAQRIPLLREAADNFLNAAGGGERQRFAEFSSRNAWWLDGFVLFDVLKQQHGGTSWKQWPRELAHRDQGALNRARRDLARELDRDRAIQFAFFDQWSALREQCGRHNIRVLGDVAIFVNYDSADVWEHPDIFRLDSELNPEFVSGVPPDAFSATGQYWGNPLYRWDVLQQRGYDWWVQRAQWALQCCDLVRLDHFRGFESYWEIPANEQTAVNGHWVKGPADDLFHRLREALGGLPFVAEDLGMITPEVHAFRDRLQIPGMRVLQFGFGNPGAHIYLPHRYEHNTVTYTGTHDNDTTLGWWKHSAAEHEKRAAQAYLGNTSDGIPWAFIRTAMHSIADLAVFPLQDILSLDSECRMNTPSRRGGNWTWRYRRDALKPELAKKLADLVEVTDRAQK